MQPFTGLKGIVVPIDRADIDTDQIIPKQFLKRIERTGFGQFLFFDWRFVDDGSPNEGFEPNKPRYKGASILLARDNFGSGSSREHAPWALKDYGIQVIIAPSFADIFYNNCFKNGMLPIVLPTGVVDELFGKVEAQEGYELEISLESQTISDDSGWGQGFEVDEFKKRVLLEGLDDIDLTLRLKDKIEAYEKKMGIA